MTHTRSTQLLNGWSQGQERAPLALNPASPTYVADIDFEAGSNFVVLRWTPATPDAVLALAFETKDRRPETLFRFE
jgi:hypothetical protein